ncbi:hypothetical protein, partial [Faecalitalea cylindroides]
LYLWIHQHQIFWFDDLLTLIETGIDQRGKVMCILEEGIDFLIERTIAVFFCIIFSHLQYIMREQDCH